VLLLISWYGCTSVLLQKQLNLLRIRSEAGVIPLPFWHKITTLSEYVGLDWEPVLVWLARPVVCL
jgi:hypothetical protein